MVALEEVGIASVMVASTEFVDAATSQARALGADPRRVFVQHPIQDRTDAEMRTLADGVFDTLLAEIVS